MKALNKSDNVPGYGIFGVWKKFISKLTDYFFTIIDEETTSLGKRTFYYPKIICNIDKIFSTNVYFDFNDYPPYSGAISENFETNINARIWCNNGFPYS